MVKNTFSITLCYIFFNMNRRIYLPCLQLTSKKYVWWIVTRTPLFFSSKVEEWLMMILVMGNCLLDLFAVFDLDLEPIWVDNSCCFCLFCFFVSQQLELNMFFIFGLDCFKRGSAKRAWELSTGQNFIQRIAIQSLSLLLINQF
jgi:hypothetical protein